MDNTQELLDTLGPVQKAHLSWRFGQLVANVSLFARGPAKSSSYDVEDEDLLRAAQEHLTHTNAIEQVKKAHAEKVAA